MEFIPFDLQTISRPCDQVSKGIQRGRSKVRIPNSFNNIVTTKKVKPVVVKEKNGTFRETTRTSSKKDRGVVRKST